MKNEDKKVKPSQKKGGRVIIVIYEAFLSLYTCPIVHKGI